jgi:GTP cyclohydrolase IA
MAEPPEHLFQQFLTWIGEDPNREGLCDTPKRMVEAWRHWTWGYGVNPAHILKTFEAIGCDEMVFQAGITTYSLCEHHCIPFFGLTHIAYVPNGRVVGLSKLARLVEVFARRLQTQENLCKEVADSLMKHLNPKGVGVVMQMRHLCMESRGVQKTGSITVTSALRGCVKNEPECRAEFLAFVNTASQGLSHP